MNKLAGRIGEAKILKVDRVQSAAEAVALENLGVNVMSVSTSADGRFKDSRFVSVETALEIQQALTTAALVLQIDPAAAEALDQLSALRRHGLTGVQTVGDEPLPDALLAEVQAHNLGVVYAGILADEDDSAAWLLSHFDRGPNPHLCTYQIELLEGHDDSWGFFRDIAARFPDRALQISEVEELAKRSPVTLGLNFDWGNFKQISRSFPSARGFHFTLGANPENPGTHHISFEELVELLTYLREC